jgi:hypothetical protein
LRKIRWRGRRRRRWRCRFLSLRRRGGSIFSTVNVQRSVPLAFERCSVIVFQGRTRRCTCNGFIVTRAVNFASGVRSSVLRLLGLEFLAIHVFGCGLVEEGLAVIFDGLLVLRGDLRGGIFDAIILVVAFNELLRSLLMGNVSIVTFHQKWNRK